MAAIWNLPVVFACENNLYGASTHIARVMCDTNIARRVRSYGMPAEQVDGNDVVAVNTAAQAAVDACRAGRGPAFLELLTYRCTGHSRRDPCHYQPSEERAAWTASDPLVRLADALQKLGTVDAAALNAIRARVVAQFHQAVERARQAPQPTVDELTTDVWA
jgi:pyruvate dehydrogenase E1 component alpha subunit